MRTCFRGRPRTVWRNRHGVASIEFAVTLPAIIVIMLVTYDLGGYVLQQMKLAQAAYAGGQDAVSYPPTDVSNSNDPNTQSLLAAIQQALPVNWTLGGDTTVSLAMTCTCGGTPLDTDRRITITLQRNYTMLLFSGIMFPRLTSTSASYVARIQ